MNPPSALHGAMSRDRKPFTYTPGGLDLSEIKSERMAKRLMRNAMNEGVPQQPVQQIQSPPASGIAVPNFNCLPVQVFPAFNLPANPKSLLRTRSNPVSREPPSPRAESQFVNKAPVHYDTFNKSMPPLSQINNNKPTSVFEYSGTPFVNYGSNFQIPENDKAFPEISYDAQYFQTPKLNNKVENTTPLIEIKSNEGTNNSESDNKDVSFTFKNDIACDKAVEKKEEVAFAPKIDIISDYDKIETEEFFTPPADKIQIIEFKPKTVTTSPEVILSVPEPNPEDEGFSNEQKQVKIVTKKESKKETKTEEQNGDKNGDTEAAVTIDLPASAPVVSSAKTATKVEITKKTLPDGSVEEVKKTITTTTVDGKTEIKTKTQTTIIPKDDEEEEEVEEEEEEEEEIQEADEKPVTVTIKAATQVKENGQDNIIKTEERSETTTTSTKKVVVIQNDKEEENEEEENEEEEVEEEIKEAEPVTVVLKKPTQPAPPQEVEENKSENEVEEEEVEEEEEEEEKKIISKETKATHVVTDQNDESKKVEQVVKISQQEEQEDVEEVEEEEEYEEAEERETEDEKKPEINKPLQKAEVEEVDNEKVSEKSVDKNEAITVEETKTSVIETKTSVEEKPAPVEVEISVTKESGEKKEVTEEKLEQIKQVVTEEIKPEKLETREAKVPLREPSVPLEKVEEVEIKPIGAGNIIRKTSTETTEIITGVPDKPTGLLTEFNRTENIVTVNRTTKTLEYENAQSQTIPTLSYFTPHIEKFPPSSQPTHIPHQPVYPSEPTSERRHSLLLDRLSHERQIPTNEIYQNTQQYSQTVEQQNQWGAQEPRVEILAVENVKPSTITNSQWYQQSEKKDIYKNDAQAPSVAPPIWTQPKQQQPVYEPPFQPTYQPPSQPAYQAPPQPTYQPQPSYQAPKPAYQPPQPQPVYQTQPQYQPQPPTPQYKSYTENQQQNTSSQQNSYTSQQYSTYEYTPKPNYTPNTQTQYTSDSYQTQKLSSTYVPPPWEQDSTYVVDNSQNYFQPTQQSTITLDLNQSWLPAPPAAKFSKTPPTAYIPPKPNQSFVKHVTIAEPPKQPGRKTYYSEYERRYISVPESTYIPGETKPQQPPTQLQPDASPAYYYDNNEPTEQVEHQWRKELREFTEKSQTEPESVQPPWETSTQSNTQSQYTKTQETTYNTTPTWSQTLRPQSWRERSFESEFVSQEWPKSNTLGRGRPLSSYGRESVIPERTRGVSVDRYNPNNYQSPVPEAHPPVQTFTHNPPAPHGPGHNPKVPAYHVNRASAEPREQPVYQQPRPRVTDSRASPFQSRSFKYLQWITGTDD